MRPRTMILAAVMLALATSNIAFSQVGCGNPRSGSCTEANQTPFCDDAVCCEQVCDFDPSCCEIEWDSGCVEAAQGICEFPSLVSLGDYTLDMYGVGVVEIRWQSYDFISGFQFDMSDVEILDVSGGITGDQGWDIFFDEDTILGFGGGPSDAIDPQPEGSLLLQVEFALLGDSIAMSNVIFSDPQGQALDIEVGPQLDINPCRLEISGYTVNSSGTGGTIDLGWTCDTEAVAYQLKLSGIEVVGYSGGYSQLDDWDIFFSGGGVLGLNWTLDNPIPATKGPGTLISLDVVYIDDFVGFIPDVVFSTADAESIPLITNGTIRLDVNPCPADLDGDGMVDGVDLGILLANWKQSGGDIDGDGNTDGVDIGLLLAQWGLCTNG